MTPDPKPPRRVRNPKAGTDKVAAEGRCRVSGRRDHLTRFHLVPKSLGGDDVDVNLVPITQSLHMRWEQGAGGKAAVGPAIWSNLNLPERDYVIRKKGPEFVRRYYGVELEPEWWEYWRALGTEAA
jgi:hypothetical protein